MDALHVGDKRKAPRFEVSIPIRQMQVNGDKVINSHTFDISSNGLGVVMDGEIPLGQDMDFNLWMPDNGESICARGRAVWMTVIGPNKYRAGIELDQVHIKPIPLVLRTIRLRSHYYG